MQTLTLDEFRELIWSPDWDSEQQPENIEDYDCMDEVPGWNKPWGGPGGEGTVEMVSTLNGITISYTENFLFADFEAGSLQVLDEGDYTWDIRGVTIEDEDGEPVDFYDIRGEMPPDFSQIDYGFLRPRLRAEVDAVDADIDEDDTVYTLRVSGGPNLRFVGALIAQTSSSKERGADTFSGEAGRWTELCLYKTKGGQYVAQKIKRTEWDGDYDRHSAQACATAEDVKSFLGYGWLAKQLYDLAGIDAAIDVDQKKKTPKSGPSM